MWFTVALVLVPLSFNWKQAEQQKSFPTCTMTGFNGGMEPHSHLTLQRDVTVLFNTEAFIV